VQRTKLNSNNGTVRTENRKKSFEKRQNNRVKYENKLNKYNVRVRLKEECCDNLGIYFVDDYSVIRL
jgi:hypothetical protein